MKEINEIKEQIKQCKDEINSKKKELESLGKQSNALYDKLAECYTNKYKEFVGKKVEIVFKDALSRTRPIEGYLKGFRSDDSYRDLAKTIYPIINKMKKDGTASLNEVSTWYLYPANNIDSIKIIS